VPVVPIPLANKRPPLQSVSGMEDTAKGSVGGGADGDVEVEEPVEDPKFIADKRCRQAVLDFLSSTDVGRLVPPVEESGAGSEVSEEELRERRDREEERAAEPLGAAGEMGAWEELPLFLPTPSFMASAGEG